MLTNKQLEKYADVLIWALQKTRCSKFKEGDIVRVSYHISALPLVEIIHKKLLELRFNPALRARTTSVIERNFFDIANDSQLVFLEPGFKELVNNLNGSIYIISPESLTHLKGVDTEKINKSANALRSIRQILDKREDEGKFGWTLCTVPTQALADHAGLTLEEYTDQVVKACFLDKKDPIEEWQSIFDKSNTVKNWLNKMDIDILHIQSENIDLEIKVGEKRKWVGVSGYNIPSFEIFLSPDWSGTRGVYYADRPSYLFGNRVEGLKVEFLKGDVIEISAEDGDDFIKKITCMDDGAKRVGEFSLTDKRFSRIDKFMADVLFDENFGGDFGNCHIALGDSYSAAFDGDPKKLTSAKKKKLGFNESALHWDIVNSEKKTVTAKLKDGTKVIIYDDGKFKN